MSEVPYEVYLEITRKKAQYGRYLDTKQWVQFQKTAKPNARLRFHDVEGNIIARNGKNYDFDFLAAFIDWFSGFFRSAQTLHMFGPPEIYMPSADEARVIWSMTDHIYFNGNGRLAEIQGGGYYHETWIKENGEWWLQDLALRRTYQKFSKVIAHRCVLRLAHRATEYTS